MRAIADLVRRTPQLLVISDEVYKYLSMTACTSTLPRYATCRALPARRALPSHRAASRAPRPAAGDVRPHGDALMAGETFSVTGWQAGWCIGPSRLVRHIQLLLPFVQFCVATPVQQACFPRVPDRPWSLDAPSTVPGSLACPRRRRRAVQRPCVLLRPLCELYRLTQILRRPSALRDATAARQRRLLDGRDVAADGAGRVPAADDGSGARMTRDWCALPAGRLLRSFQTPPPITSPLLSAGRCADGSREAGVIAFHAHRSSRLRKHRARTSCRPSARATKRSLKL